MTLLELVWLVLNWLRLICIWILGRIESGEIQGKGRSRGPRTRNGWAEVSNDQFAWRRVQASCMHWTSIFTKNSWVRDTGNDVMICSFYITQGILLNSEEVQSCSTWLDWKGTEQICCHWQTSPHIESGFIGNCRCSLIRNHGRGSLSLSPPPPLRQHTHLLCICLCDWMSPLNMLLFLYVYWARRSSQKMYISKYYLLECWDISDTHWFSLSFWCKL